MKSVATMKFELLISLLTACVSFIGAFTPLRSHGFKDTVLTSASYRNTARTILLRMSDEDIFDAEETAVFDAHDVSDPGVEAAVMERAVMMAYDMMKKKKMELKEKVQDARAAEQQYVMMEQATKDLVEQYNEDVSKRFEGISIISFFDEQINNILASLSLHSPIHPFPDPSRTLLKPTKFKKSHSNLNGAQVAIEMLESVIADAAQKMVDIENDKDLVISQFYETLEEEHKAEARAAKETLQEEEASNRVYFVEEFDDAYEIQERQRDFAVAHAARQAANVEAQRIQDLSSEEESLLDKEEKLERQLAEHRRNEDILKADLREIQEIVRDELLKEWEREQRLQQEQQGLM